MRLDLPGTVTWRLVDPLPDDPRAWLARTLGTAIDSDEQRTTASGWRFRVVTGRAGDEHRLVALYMIFEHGAVVVASAPSAEQLRAFDPILAAVTPSWDDQIAALSQLLDIRATESVRAPLVLAIPHTPAEIAEQVRLIQHLHATGEHTAAEAALVELRAQRPACDEIVIDRFEVGAITVHAIGPLASHGRFTQLVLAFRAPGVEVRIETSAYARERGTPYVLGVARGEAFEVIGVSERLPPYAELRAKATELIAQSV